MSIRACSFVTDEVDSWAAGRDAARHLGERFAGAPLSCVLVYATVNHAAPRFLAGLREHLGPGPLIAGCSTQGIAARERVLEQGYALGAIGLGGALQSAVAAAAEINLDPAAKGAALGASLRRSLGARPKVVILYYDPLCGADVEALLAALHAEVRCPVIGGAAGHSWGAGGLIKTYQYAGDGVLEHCAVAVGLGGDFAAATGFSSGTASTGIAMQVTRCDRNVVLELDGNRALDVWREISGSDGTPKLDETPAVALAIPPRDGDLGDVPLVRAALMFDAARGGLILQAPIAEGTKVLFHHRTVDSVLQGTDRLAGELRARVGGRHVAAVLTFECGARTGPFLGAVETLKENVALQRRLAPEAEWLGMMAFGEVAPHRGAPGFFNYTLPVLVLMDE